MTATPTSLSAWCEYDDWSSSEDPVAMMLGEYSLVYIVLAWHVSIMKRSSWYQSTGYPACQLRAPPLPAAKVGESDGPYFFFSFFCFLASVWSLVLFFLASWF